MADWNNVKYSIAEFLCETIIINEKYVKFRRY